jgi:hypothetical protein
MPCFALLLCLIVAGSARSQAAGTAYLSIEGVPPDAATPAPAADEWVLYLDGEFDSGAAVRLAAFIAQQRIARASVYFNSSGGSLIAAMGVGRLLREHQFQTRVGRRTADPRRPGNGVCYSACPFAYAGGGWRFLDSGAVLGVHRVANRVPVPDEFAFEQVVSRQATLYLAAMGISPELFRMMEQVPREEIRLLSREEAVRLQLVNDGMTPADSFNAGVSERPVPAH